MDQESVALLQLMAKMNAEVVRPAQMRRDKNLCAEENGHNGNPTLRDYGKSVGSGLYSVDMPVQGSLPQLPLQGIPNAHDTAPCHGVVCEPGINLRPTEKQ